MNFPSIDGDRDRDDPHAWVREESRNALHVNEMQRHTDCTHHRYRPNHRGGGTCDCGDEVYPDEF